MSIFEQGSKYCVSVLFLVNTVSETMSVFVCSLKVACIDSRFTQRRTIKPSGASARTVTNCLRVISEWPIDVTIAIIVVIVTSMDWSTPSACDERYNSSAQRFGTSGTSHGVYTGLL